MRALQRFVLVAGLAAAVLGSLPGCGKRVDYTSLPPISTAPLPDLQSTGLTNIWQRQLSLDPGERVKKAWRVGKSVYVATNLSRLAQIDARSGVLQWSVGLGGENFDIYKPIELPTDDGSPAKYVLAVTRGDAFILHMETGDEFRRGHLGISVSADPIVVGNTLGVGGAGRFLGIYLDRLNGRRWSLTSAGDLFNSAPVPVDNNIILASKKGLVWRLSADTGEWDWKDRKTNGEVSAGLTADSNAVYIPSLDKRVYAFDSATGAELWQTQLSGTLDQQPVLTERSVLVISSGVGLFALAKEKGGVLWEVPGVTQIGSVGSTSVWVVANGKLTRLSLLNGSVLAEAETPSLQILLKNPVDQNVILVSGGGSVGMYRQR